MKNINNTFDNFPVNSEEYNANKPINLTCYQWLFDPTNPYYFPFWVSILINKIHWASLMRGWTFFKQRNLPALFPESIRKCVDTLSIYLHRLVAINVLEMRIIKKNKQYRVNWELLHSTNISTVNNPSSDVVPTMIRTIFDENILENSFDTIVYEDEIFPISEDWYINNRSYDHQVDDHNLSDSKILGSDKTDALIQLDPIEIEIKQEFEALTGKSLNLKKNRKPLAKLREMAETAKDVVMLAFSNVANHCAEKGTKVYNLAYVLTAAENLMRPKTSPKNTPQDYVAASEQDKAYASVGGDPAKNRLVEPELSPEQKAEESKVVLLKLEHYRIETELFNDLDQQTKEEMIQEEIELMKTQPIWEKIKPQYSWSFNGHIISLAIERIKGYLLREYLDYQAFLLAQAPG